MASKSSASTAPTASPRCIVIVDDLPYTVAPVRTRRRGGRLCNLGSMENRNSSYSVKGSCSKFASSTKARTSSTCGSSYKGKAKVDNEPLVSEIIPQEFNFAAICAEWNNNINK